MRHATLDLIREEHQALAAMLRSIVMMLAQSRRERTVPDFEVLRAMLFYIDEFSERRHHRHESEGLFPAVLRRCPEVAEVVARLEREHQAGESAIRELQHALLAFEMMGEARRAAFEQAAERYQRFYLAHMQTEEQLILPAALAKFSAADWAPLDAVFGAHGDALAGGDALPDYQPLFRRILMHAPVPIGLGSPR
jgi:hemerythrin-like domain-containing protein